MKNFPTIQTFSTHIHPKKHKKTTFSEKKSEFSNLSSLGLNQQTDESNLQQPTFSMAFDN